MKKKVRLWQKIVNIFLLIMVCFGVYVCINQYRESGFTISLLKVIVTLMAGIGIVLKNTIMTTLFLLLFVIIATIQIAFFDISSLYLNLILVVLCVSSVYRNIRLLYKNRFNFYYNKGLKFCKNEEYEKAIEYGNKAIALGCIHSELFYYLGIAYHYLHQYKAARENYTKAITLGLSTDSLYFNLGSVYLKLEGYVQAIENFSFAIEKNPKNIDAFYYRAIVYTHIKDYKKALLDYEKVLELDPTNEQALKKRNELCATKKQLQ